jgi:pimeloyl-ACP methyl ester carboxylesterase
VRCGTLVVPEERGNPESPTLELRVVILEATGDEPLSDPLFITFGPYNMGFSYFLGFTSLWGRYLDKRDLVVLDPRGSGRAGHNLDCPELRSAYLETLEMEFNSIAVKDKMVEAHQTCRHRGDSLVTSLKNLNMVAMAEDFEDLRQALGYEKVNIQAWGSGTRLAEIWSTSHPDSIRTITMVSPIPLDANIFLNQVKSVDRAIQSVFQECAASKSCATAFPNLDRVFSQLVEDLNAHPLDVEVNYLEEGQNYTMRLNGDRLIDLAYVMATSTYAEWIGFLPQLIYETKAGNMQPVTDSLGGAANLGGYINFTSPSGTPFAQGIWCDEILDSDAKDAILAQIDLAPVMYKNYLEKSIEMQSAICAVWGGRENRPASGRTTKLTVPALFLTSDSDIIAPEEVAAQMTKRFTPVYINDFTGGGGEQALAWLDCWSKMQTAFMIDPTIPPQEACVQKKPAISWITFKP